MKKDILHGISITGEVILGVGIPLFLFAVMVCSHVHTENKKSDDEYIRELENQIDQYEEKLETLYNQLNELKSQ